MILSDIKHNFKNHCQTSGEDMRRKSELGEFCTKKVLLLKSYDILCNIRRCMLLKGLWHSGNVLMFLSILRY